MHDPLGWQALVRKETWIGDQGLRKVRTCLLVLRVLALSADRRLRSQSLIESKGLSPIHDLENRAARSIINPSRNKEIRVGFDISFPTEL